MCQVNNHSRAYLLIDGGSCNNFVSETFLFINDLVPIDHISPYKIQWINDDHEVKVERMVFLNIRIGSYVDRICFDVIPLTYCDLILGRPWQFDKVAIHNGFMNCFTFYEDGEHHILEPLSPNDIFQKEKRGKRQRVCESTLANEQKPNEHRKNKSMGCDEVRNEVKMSDAQKEKEKEKCGEEKRESEGETFTSNKFVHFAGVNESDSRTNPSQEGGDDENNDSIMSLASDGSRKSLFTSYLARKARKSVSKEVPVVTSDSTTSGRL